ARRSIVGMVGVMDPARRGAHDAYHRLVRAGAWSLTSLFEVLARLALGLVTRDSLGRVVCYLDDTLFHRPGRHVEGAASWRDAVRSTRSRVVYARGLNLVVLAVRCRAPWGGMEISLPVNLRLHHKNGKTMPELAAEMIAELASWLSQESFVLCCDGAYATLAGHHLERTVVVSRMRRDAALYEAPPARTGKRGRPRKRGKRLPTPLKLARAARRWTEVELDWRGRNETRLIWTRDVLWYRVCPEALVRLVVVRDPKGIEPDDYFFTTDLQMAPAEVVEIYAGRWSIEVCYRDVKQVIGGQQPESWKGKGPERAAGLSFWLYGAIWIWYLAVSGEQPSFTRRAWYPKKKTPSFADALAELRRVLWRDRISVNSRAAKLDEETVNLLVDALAVAA
ncbi:MAG: IS701 family transposase, partial [Gaiellaceae bacterium]